MTTSLKVKVVRKATVKLKVLPKFPANIVAANFVTLTRAGNTYTLSADYSVLTPGPINDPTTAFVAISDTTAGIYRTVTLASLLASGLDADLQAIAALTGTGILARTSDGTWALRTIAGTASRITVTNGDGVAGAPAIDISASYVGQTSLTTLGTVATGTWQATKVGLAYGGTNADLSATGGTHQVLKQVSSGAAVTVGQLAFTDISGSVAATQMPAFTGDVTTVAGAVATTLATVNANVGSFGSATQSVQFTVNGKGLMTAAANVTVTPAISSVTGLGTGVATFLATPSSANLRAALTDEVGTGAAYFVGGALGTPASATLTNATGLPLSGLTTQAAFTFVGNNTSGSAAPTAVDIAALTAKASPATTDLVMISDQAASGAWKKVTVSSLASAGSVASIAGNTGAFTLSGGITNATNDIRIDGVFGLRNRIINPTGQIAQIAFAATSDGSYTGFDQWYALTQSNPVTPSQNAAPEAGTPYMMRLTQSNASAQRFGLATPLEVDNARELRSTQLTLSARLQCSASTTIRYAVIEWSGTPDSITRDIVNDWTSATFTTGNFFISTTTAISAIGSIALTANTLTSITPLTFTAGSSHQNLIVFFWTDSTQAQNVTLDIGRVQLEKGSTATGFAIRPTSVEQTLCNRFLRVKGNGIAISQHINVGMAFSTTIFRTVFALDAPMRVAPTGSLSAASDFQLDDSVVNPVGTSSSFTTSVDQVTLQLNVASGLTAARAGFLQAANTNARIYLKAQL